MLVALVRHRGELVTKRDLLACVWQDTFVEDGILTVYISILRKALGDTRRPARYIETVAGFGYRFISPIVRRPAPYEDTASPVPFRQRRATEHLTRGRHQLLNGSCFALQDAVESFESAIRADPSDASAYALFALARCAQAQNVAVAPQRAYRDATRAVLRAIALDHRDPNVHVALGTLLLLNDWDWVGADRAARRALEQDVENVDAYMLRGNLLDARGETDDALDAKMRALDYAPTSPFVLTQIALSLWRRRDYEGTITWTERALAQDPRHVGARMYLAFALWKIARYEAVTDELLTQAESFGITRETFTRAIATSRRAPDEGRWPSRLTRFVMRRLPTAAGGASAINAAIASGERGERDAAFRHLDGAIRRRESCLIHLAVDPQWDSLRSDSRFQQRLEYIRRSY